MSEKKNSTNQFLECPLCSKRLKNLKDLKPHLYNRCKSFSKNELVIFDGNNEFGKYINKIKESDLNIRDLKVKEEFEKSEDAKSDKNNEKTTNLKKIKKAYKKNVLSNLKTFNPFKKVSKKIRQFFGKKEYEEYSEDRHGPLINTESETNSNQEIVETYWINKPYACVRILYDTENHSDIYEVMEPKLSEFEEKILNEIKKKLIEFLDINLNEMESNPKKYLKKEAAKIREDFGIRLNPKQRAKINYYITRDFHGYGRIDPLMRDPYIEDISCDGPSIPVYIYHQKYESAESNIYFEKESELDSFVIKLAQKTGRHISIAEPLLDGTLPDGSRIQISLGKEVTTRGSTFTIRKYKENPFTPPDLVDFNTFSTAMVAYLWMAVENGKSAIFGGGTASGKTTSLNAISLFIPPEMKITTIEDTRELNLPQPNWIPGVTRESYGGAEETSIEMYDLLKSALRQRPEYIIVGEVRGNEAYVLFQAMATGHTTFSTMHADSIESAVHRLENPPINIPRSMLEALDIFTIQIQTRTNEGRVRRCKEVIEIVGVDPHTNELITNNVFKWIPEKDEFKYSGTSHIFEEIMEEQGMDEKEIKEEFEKRQKIVEWMRIKDIRHYEDVAKIVVGYYKEPEKTMKFIEEELYSDQKS